MSESLRGTCRLFSLGLQSRTGVVRSGTRLRVWKVGLKEENPKRRRTKRREKNRVAAQKSRKRQTQRADQLHQACELLEQRNRKLKREVDSLSEEQNFLSQALRAHEPFCPIMHCSFASSSLQPDAAARSV
uniref:Basic leucine zipper transcription factor, ATF-like 3 n=1 Tax=Poecilia reticulata TaxID=8081 RepID=A0A3P9PG10_POERE